ncbi:MAG: rhomboid family intramembrane serine protease [Planctomycetota bacterium]
MQQNPNVVTLAFRSAPVVAVTIAINVLVFLMWQLAQPDTARPTALAEFAFENFMVSTSHLEHGYVWTLLTSAYSHIDLWHVLVNMFVLGSFGLALERLWGWRTFLSFYLICSVVGSLSHCLSSAVLIGDARPALGASGAVCGLLMAFGLHFPQSKILVFGIIPVPALVGVLAFVAFDIWGLIEQGRGGGAPIGHGAHLGGGLAGAVMWFAWLRPRFHRRQVQRLER